MKFIINGEEREFEANFLTVTELLNLLELPLDHLAVELNKNIVAKANFGETQIAEADQVEIVRFVGGG